MPGQGNDPVRLAIVGLGRWGQTLVNAVQGRSEAVIFTYGVTRTPSTCSAFARDQGITMLPSLDALLAEESIDGIVLATPHSHHAEQIVASVARRKHVLCEKPLALTMTEGAAAFDAAEAAGVHLCVAHNRRFLPAFDQMRRRLPEIGSVMQLIGNFSWGPVAYRPGAWRASLTENPVGGMTGLGIHMIDLMIALGLMPQAVSVWASGDTTTGTDATVTALIDAGPAVGVLTTMMGPGRCWRLEAFGTEGWLILEGEERLRLRRGQEVEETIDFEATDIEAVELETFAATIRGRSAWPVTRREALDGLALFETICRTAQRPRDQTGWAEII